MTTSRRRPPKRIAPEEMANVLAYAALHSDKAAAQQFNVSSRTLQRYRAEMRAGKHPALAALVEQNKRETTTRCQDLLLGVYERGLAALARRIEDAGLKTRMKDRDLVGAIHILGNQLVTRNVLTGDEQPTGNDREGAATAAPGARGEAAPAGGSRPELH